MKKFNILYFLLFTTIVFLTACKDGNKSPQNTINQKSEISDSLEERKSNAIIDIYKNANASTTSAAFHYTCPKGCSGGAASAVNCSNCGTLLAHNAAYHNQPNNTSNNSPFSNSTNNSPASTPNNSSTNNSGVYHYICEKGCAGGSASAGDCSNCGSTLAHNAAYHN